jgi:thiamine-phosphate pyrophosphorylase
VSLSDARRRRLRGLEAARIYLVVTEAACRGPWETAVERALSTGAVGAVQLREKELGDLAFVDRAVRLRGLAEDAGVLFLLNDRAHLVARTGADGVHVGEEDLPPDEARRVAGASVIVGLSTHCAAEVAWARRVGADYVGIGPCFPSTTKRLERAPGGPALVRAAVAAADLPVFPIGGITPQNVRSLVDAGADRVAVGAGILADEDPAEATIAIAAALRPSKREGAEAASPEPRR